MERNKEEKRRAEWDAMTHLAKTYPKKYSLSIGIENVYLWELKDFGKQVFYWFPVMDLTEQQQIRDTEWEQ